MFSIILARCQPTSSFVICIGHNVKKNCDRYIWSTKNVWFQSKSKLKQTYQMQQTHLHTSHEISNPICDPNQLSNFFETLFLTTERFSLLLLTFAFCSLLPLPSWQKPEVFFSSIFQPIEIEYRSVNQLLEINNSDKRNVSQKHSYAHAHKSKPSNTRCDFV